MRRLCRAAGLQDLEFPVRAPGLWRTGNPEENGWHRRRRRRWWQRVKLQSTCVWSLIRLGNTRSACRQLGLKLQVALTSFGTPNAEGRRWGQKPHQHTEWCTAAGAKRARQMEATFSQSLKMFKFQPFVAPDREFIFDVNLCNLWLKFNCHSGQLHRLLPWASNFKPVGREIPEINLILATMTKCSPSRRPHLN